MSPKLWTIPAPRLEDGTTLQIVPFHCSIRGCELGWLDVDLLPAAQTSFADRAVTASNRLLPWTSGLGTTLHLLPFQWSIRVVKRFRAKSLTAPTDQMSSGATAKTLLRTCVSGLGFGLGITVHVL